MVSNCKNVSRINSALLTPAVSTYTSRACLSCMKQRCISNIRLYSSANQTGTNVSVWKVTCQYVSTTIAILHVMHSLQMKNKLSTFYSSWGAEKLEFSLDALAYYSWLEHTWILPFITVRQWCFFTRCTLLSTAISSSLLYWLLSACRDCRRDEEIANQGYSVRRMDARWPYGKASFEQRLCRVVVNGLLWLHTLPWCLPWRAGEDDSGC